LAGAVDSLLMDVGDADCAFDSVFKLSAMTAQSCR